MKNKNIIKIIVTIGVLIAYIFGLLSLTGCGNKDLWDTNYTFNTAICNVGGEYKKIEIRQWKDYEGEQIQIIDKQGKIYLTSTNTCTLIKE